MAPFGILRPRSSLRIVPLFNSYKAKFCSQARKVTTTVNMANPTFLAIIPARGGSKGLLKKNIIETAGRPLISWTIDAAVHSKYLSRIIVSSDDPEILEIAQSNGAETFQRPNNLALDETPMQPVVHHVINKLKVKDEKYDNIVLLQPTSPARNTQDIDQAISLLLKHQATSLISVYEPLHSPFKAFMTDEQGHLKGIINNQMPFQCRQNLPKAYMPNGAIHIISTNEFKKYNSFHTDKCIPFVMPRNRSMDIDSSQDLSKFVNFIRGHRKEA